MDHHDQLTTFAVAAALGVFLLTLAVRIRVSAIVILLVGGIVAGPEVLGLVNPDHLGSGLNTIISLAVGLILFEGGLTLDIKGFKQVSKEIWGVLTKGVLITWLTSALLIKFVFDFDWVFCFFSGSLIIVTGPTVIGPLLQRIRVRKNLHHILHWEGVLIDPIGVFIALLCYEYFLSTTGAGAHGDSAVLVDFLLRFAVGAVLGLLFGLLVSLILKRQWVQKEYLNIFVLAFAMLNYAMADLIVLESGLLSVTIAGLVVGYQKPPNLERIVRYKVELKDFLIGLLFVLLAANLELSKFTDYGVALIWVVAAVMFIVRPLNIFISTRKSGLVLKEKVFLSWIAPRGIVAASMASVCALNLSNSHPEAGFLETFTYSVIAGTVVFQGFTAKMVGKMLGVVEPRPTGWIIVGSHRLGRILAHFIQEQGKGVVLVDTNAREIRQAIRENLPAICDDAMTVDHEKESLLYGCGNFVALTANEDLNYLLCQRWNRPMRDGQLYRWEKEGIDPTKLDSRMVVGKSLWPDMELGPWINHGDEEVPVKTIQIQEGEEVPETGILLSCAGDEIIPGPPISGYGPANLLVIEEVEAEQAPQLPVQPEWVVFSEAEDLEGLYARMLGLIAQQAPQLDREALLKDLLAREEEFTSLLGHGISMPHSYSNKIASALLLVARANVPIPCQHTGTGIELVFMLLSPEDQPTEHLGHISHIARLIGKETGRNALLTAESPRDLYEAIAQG